MGWKLIQSMGMGGLAFGSPITFHITGQIQPRARSQSPESKLRATAYGVLGKDGVQIIDVQRVVILDHPAQVLLGINDPPWLHTW